MRRLIVAASFVLAACGRTPSAPSTTPSAPLTPVAAADFSGLWTGSFRLTSCAGDRHCGILMGTTRTFTLRLRQSGSQVQGLFTQSIYAADVAGEVLKDGTVLVSGSAPAANTMDGSMRVTGLALRATPTRALEGTVAYETEPSAPAIGVEFRTTISGDVVSITRSDLQTFAAAVDGTWSGRFAVRSCVPPARSLYCYPYGDQEMVNLELSLTRSGDAVTGTFGSGSNRVPVSGRISGSSISLSGESLVSGGTTVIRVSAWNGSVDGFGRMRGTFRFDFGYPSGAPTLGESAAAELWQVVKIP